MKGQSSLEAVAELRTASSALAAAEQLANAAEESLLESTIHGIHHQLAAVIEHLDSRAAGRRTINLRDVVTYARADVEGKDLAFDEGQC